MFHNGFLVSKETVVLRRWERSKQPDVVNDVFVPVAATQLK